MYSWFMDLLVLLPVINAGYVYNCGHT